MAATPDRAPYTAPALFDSLGPAYEEAYSGNPEQTASIEWLLAELAKPARILDVGCSTGRPVCTTLSEAGHSVLGIDVSRVMISAARERAPKAKFQQVDYREFESRPNVYDAITVYFSLILDLTQEEIRDSFRKFYDWLKPGGLFVFATVPVAGNKPEIKWMGRPIVVSSFAAEDVVAAVKRRGLKSSRRTPRCLCPGRLRLEFARRRIFQRSPSCLSMRRKMSESVATSMINLPDKSEEGEMRACTLDPK